jgi:hypothetical protein
VRAELMHERNLALIKQYFPSDCLSKEIYPHAINRRCFDVLKADILGVFRRVDGATSG